MTTTAIIPARYGSQRFPGKLLAELDGRPVIQHVYERVAKAQKIDDVIIATDHDKIKAVAEAFGARVIMTSDTLQSGTDRCAAVAEVLDPAPDFIINVQGDEPLIAPQLVDDLATALHDDEAPIATAIRRMHDASMLFSSNVVKVVKTRDGQALYFSRQPIPFYRGLAEDEWLQHHTFFQHIGMYGFQTKVLLKLAALAPTSLEQAESLEQLRWLEHGYTIKTIRTEYESWGVDTPEDLEKLERLFGNQ